MNLTVGNVIKEFLLTTRLRHYFNHKEELTRVGVTLTVQEETP